MKKGILIARIIGITALIILSACQIRNPYLKREYVNSEGDTLRYRLLKPHKLKKSQSYPLVIFLHGSGERGRDNEAQLLHGTSLFLQENIRIDYPAYVMVPQCPPEERWVEAAWNQAELKQPEEISYSLRLVMETVHILMKRFNIDPDRIYVTGLSMGGYGTWDLLCRFPEFFAAGVPVCGGGDTQCASLLTQMPIWAFHGAKDKVVPVEQSRKMIEAIRESGGKPIYTEYPETEHNAWTPAYNEAELIPWLFSQNRKER
ncbi:MAG TPA: phospholipase [Candidatus Marinimicrobia bacterium]|nr:phospholipase [Candidatus Neomarinimicrobiota bacterium]